MDIQKLIIYKFKSLYEIIKELENNFNFTIMEVSDEKILNNNLNKFDNYLIVTQEKINQVDNQLILSQFPIKISKLIEKINIQFLKLQFNEKSKIIIGKYYIDLNSRKLVTGNINLKLTEKETNIIIYLYQSNDAVGVEQLQSKVWDYQSKLETHTVETHIYRLRKKILKTFNDDNFIISKKNGYQII
jgi:hypothetical protein